jgi:molecular chaperone GrpE (heat shock protein)
MNKALDYIGIRSTEATAQANKYRDKAPTLAEANAVDMKSYKQGEAIGFNDAYKIMYAELQRLQNRFQNNVLTIDDFSTSKLFGEK